MKLLASAAVATACLLATPALAQDAGLYGTIGLQHMDAKHAEATYPGLDGVNDLGFEMVTGRVGYSLNRYFSAELEGSFGWEDATTHVTNPDPDEDDLPVSVSVNTDLAAFLVGRLPMTDNASLTFRVGYGSTDADATVGDVSAGEDFTGYRYGAGAEFFFDDANGVRFDFTRIDAEDGLDADTYAVSYVRKFGF
ncbi:MAG TPA: porin family protein [Caulobacteraceae bacterium]